MYIKLILTNGNRVFLADPKIEIGEKSVRDSTAWFVMVDKYISYYRDKEETEASFGDCIYNMTKDSGFSNIEGMFEIYPYAE
jgi:hypothetical protein